MRLRRAALFLEALLGQPCCPALAVKMQGQVTAALRPAYEGLLARLPAQAHLGVDESPTKEAQAKAWLWTFVAARFTVFAWRPTRAATVLSEVLTARFAGVDLSGRMLQRARARRPAAGGLELVQGDSERLPFGADSFDVVTCAHSFRTYDWAGATGLVDDLMASYGRESHEASSHDSVSPAKAAAS